MANEREIKVPENIIDKLGIPKEFMENHYFINDLNKWYDNLTATYKNDQNFDLFLQEHLKLKDKSVTLYKDIYPYIKGKGYSDTIVVKEAIKYNKLDDGNFTRTIITKDDKNSDIREKIDIANLLPNEGNLSAEKLTQTFNTTQILEQTTNEDLDALSQKDASYWDKIETRDIKGIGKFETDDTIYIASKNGYIRHNISTPEEQKEKYQFTLDESEKKVGIFQKIKNLFAKFTQNRLALPQTNEETQKQSEAVKKPEDTATIHGANYSSLQENITEDVLKEAERIIENRSIAASKGVLSQVEKNSELTMHQISSYIEGDRETKAAKEANKQEKKYQGEHNQEENITR